MIRQQSRRDECEITFRPNVLDYRPSSAVAFACRIESYVTSTN
jgi:hypothetical protein